MQAVVQSSGTHKVPLMTFLTASSHCSSNTFKSKEELRSVVSLCVCCECGVCGCCLCAGVACVCVCGVMQ